MAGLYIHIPFCASRCVYCGFFSTTHLDKRQAYVEALCREMQLRSLVGPISPISPISPMGPITSQIDTVYLGGGTPSQLSAEQLQQLFLYISNVYDVSPKAEVTIECNPDDVSTPFVATLSRLPVNRVSMGAQSFNDERLHFLRRRHRAAQVGEAVQLLRSAGISNISIDLMYGFPDETMDEWNADIDASLALEVEHLSAYALSYEEGTSLYTMLQQGKVKELDEELQREMYYTLKDRLEASGYEHYELSNFARKEEREKRNEEGFRSRHNSSYWNHTPYIGIGAGAHSFDGRHRQWNVADIDQYVKAIGEGRVPADGEEIDDLTRYNETVMTALRTVDGIQLDKLSSVERAHCLAQAKKFLDCDWLCRPDDHTLRLTRDGLFVSDTVITALML
ncbi:MAG: radical SAM family heme chaperone HemW [Prevotella sp.]|nr:radical SAM family heme chaperone HemW [Prevotella sp.]